MYKQVMLLGLLLEKPMYGQQIREVIEKHHDLFADFVKKPIIYYHLRELAKPDHGYLEIRSESVEAPGPGAAHGDVALRERDVYYITDKGRQYFYKLLRNMLSNYTPGLSEVDAGLFFLHRITPGEAVTLLTERHKLVTDYRATVTEQIANHINLDDAHQLVNDHKLTLIDAELRWLEGAIEHLRASKANQT
ncbi:MAG TPA: PadR family transcriptional regulator [Ktedonosporobacter sp.]|nr:PadR family transcriptional regulator [Ktedonosporobacter sp.]